MIPRHWEINDIEFHGIVYVEMELSVNYNYKGPYYYSYIGLKKAFSLDAKTICSQYQEGDLLIVYLVVSAGDHSDRFHRIKSYTGLIYGGINHGHIIMLDPNDHDPKDPKKRKVKRTANAVLRPKEIIFPITE